MTTRTPRTSTHTCTQQHRPWLSLKSAVACCCVADSGEGKNSWNNDVVQRAVERNENKRVRGDRAGYLKVSQSCEVFHAPARLSEAEPNPLRKRSRSATLNARSTTTEIGWDPDMRRNVATYGPLAEPAPERARKNVRPPENIMLKQKCIFYVGIHVGVSEYEYLVYCTCILFPAVPRKWPHLGCYEAGLESTR